MATNPFLLKILSYDIIHHRLEAEESWLVERLEEVRQHKQNIELLVNAFSREDVITALQELPMLPHSSFFAKMLPNPAAPAKEKPVVTKRASAAPAAPAAVQDDNKEVEEPNQMTMHCSATIVQLFESRAAACGDGKSRRAYLRDVVRPVFWGRVSNEAESWLRETIARANGLQNKDIARVNAEIEEPGTIAYVEDEGFVLPEGFASKAEYVRTMVYFDLLAAKDAGIQLMILGLEASHA
jgi:hypothetical protein